MRQNQTPQEEIIWQSLKAGRFGYKFKRQHSVGGYILDFYCAQKKLAIEIDGGIHNKKEAKEYDKIRDDFLNNLGIKILRIWNSEIEENLNSVLTKINITLSNL